MRLIDGDAITLALRLAVKQLAEERREFLMDFRDGLEAASNACEEAPTIDALPVIRCQNCKHFAEFRAEAKKDGADGTCRRLLMKVVENDFSSVRATDFCSYGERKE